MNRCPLRSIRSYRNSCIRAFVSGWHNPIDLMLPCWSWEKLPATSINKISINLHFLINLNDDDILIKILPLLTHCRTHILPICMPSKPMDIVGRSGYIAGWGKISQDHGHTGTNILRTAQVPIICEYLHMGHVSEFLGWFFALNISAVAWTEKTMIEWKYWKRLLNINWLFFFLHQLSIHSEEWMHSMAQEEKYSRRTVRWNDLCRIQEQNCRCMFRG